MSKSYAPSTGGFYDTQIHGELTIREEDPQWNSAEHPDEPVPTVEVRNPACKIPLDAVAISDADYEALFAAQAAGKVIGPSVDTGHPVASDPPQPTQDEIKKRLSICVQAHLDAQAQSMGYDSIFTAATYADEPAIAKFQAEGKALRAWRSAVWASCYETLDAVTNGVLPVPTAQDLITSLPAFVL